MKKIKNWKRNFYTMWFGQAISLITSGVLQMAIIFYLTQKTGSALVLSMATFVGLLPQALLGPFIGAIVDRYNRKTVMIYADVFIAFAGMILVIVGLYNQLPIWMIMLVLLVRSIGTAFHTPAVSAATPLIVPQDQLVKCSGYIQAIQSVSLILSPVIAAMLYSIVNLNYIILLDVIGALIAVGMLLVVKIPTHLNNEEIVERNLYKEVKSGLNILKKEKLLFSIVLIGALFLFAYMPISALFPLMVMDYFNGTPFNLSLVEIIFAVGMLLGGLVLGKWGGIKNKGILLTIMVFIIGLATSLSGLLTSNQIIIFALLNMIVGFCGSIYSATLTTMFQEKINLDYLGRVFALYTSIASLAMPLGLIISGIFADKIGVPMWFIISGILIVIAGLLMVLSSKRHNE